MPEQATVVRGGAEVTVSPGELVVGELMLVRPGERLATDGVVRAGRSILDVSALTGESMPVEAGVGQEVFAGSINGGGALDVEVTTLAENNSLARIVRIVEAEQARKGAGQRLADRIARPMVPGIMVLASLIALVGILADDPRTWIERALVVLVAASPCALAIERPAPERLHDTGRPPGKVSCRGVPPDSGKDHPQKGQRPVHEYAVVLGPGGVGLRDGVRRRSIERKERTRRPSACKATENGSISWYTNPGPLRSSSAGMSVMLIMLCATEWGRSGSREPFHPSAPRLRGGRARRASAIAPGGG